MRSLAHDRTAAPLGAAAAGVVLRQSQGLGTPSAPPLDPFGAWVRRKRRYRVAGRQWLSPLGYYFGPFEGPSSLPGAHELFRRTSLGGKPPSVYLTATETGLGIIPTSNWIMRLGRGALSRAEDARLILAASTTAATLGWAYGTHREFQ